MLPIVAAGLLTLVVVFRDQTLATVYDAVRIRFTVGPSLSWHEEYFRYFFITVSTDDGALTRRVPVLLLLASLFVVLAVMLRRKRIRGIDPRTGVARDRCRGRDARALGLHPDEVDDPVRHLRRDRRGLAAVATVAIAQSAARSSRNLMVLVAGLLFALAASMAGKNARPWAYDFGISWFDRAPVLAGIQVSSILLVLAVIASAAAVWLHLRPRLRRARRDGPRLGDGRRTRRHRLARRPSSPLSSRSSPIAVIAIVMAVAELAVRQGRGGPAVVHDGQRQLDALRGNTCAMADDALVEQDANAGTLTPADGRSASDALAGTDPVGFTPNGVAPDLSPRDLSPGRVR